MKTFDELGDIGIYVEQPCTSMESCNRLQQYVSILCPSFIDSWLYEVFNNVMFFILKHVSFLFKLHIYLSPDAP